MPVIVRQGVLPHTHGRQGTDLDSGALLGEPDTIYTRTGDDGTTNLGDMSKTSKLDLRIAAYADVDEANSQIGLAIALGGLEDDVVKVLTHVQNDMFDVGADLSCPVVEQPEFPPLRVEPDYIDRLEGVV